MEVELRRIGTEPGDDSDDLDLEEEEALMKELEEASCRSLLQEIQLAFWNARYMAPITALIGVFLAYQLAVAPYQVNFMERQVSAVEDLGTLRPVLSPVEMRIIHTNLMHAETQFWMPLPSYDTIKLRFHPAVTSAGVHQPPELFYKGVVFGLTDKNSHKLSYTESHRDLAYTDLHQDLLQMRPHPTNVMMRLASNNGSRFEEAGYAVYFSYEDLEKQGKLSSDTLKPWKRVLEDILVIARNYRQVCVTAWYPHTFGMMDDELDPYKYVSLIQQVIPTRTGLFELQSTVPVWMSAINNSAPQKPELVYNKEWTEDDHPSMYVRGGSKWYSIVEWEDSQPKRKTLEKREQVRVPKRHDVNKR